MGLITLADGTQHNLNKGNSDTLAKQQLAIYRARGMQVDEAATYQAFLEGAGRDTSFDTVPGTTIATKQAANVYADQVEDVPIVGGLTAVSTAGDKAKAYAATAFDEFKKLAGQLPGAADKLNKTIEIALVVGGIAVVGFATVYIIHKFKR